MKQAAETLAIRGGTPVREHMLPYGRQTMGVQDEEAVLEVLRSGWLTTGPVVREFEKAFAEHVGVPEAVAVSSGTAALHLMAAALQLKPDDEVIVPAITFVATANAVVFQGARPVFADVRPDSLLIDPDDVARRITKRTRAVIAVDYAGLPCDYTALKEVCDRHSVRLLADACHSLGASFDGRQVGSLAECSAFSFHPVKNMTTGEGGMVTCGNTDMAATMRSFRNHGIQTEFRQREAQVTHFYDMTGLGYNYRITDMQCALGLAQLKRLEAWVRRRREIAAQYREALAQQDAFIPLADGGPGRQSAYHLFVVRLRPDSGPDRDEVFTALRAEGIGVNVHYRPVYLHTFYQQRFGYRAGECPEAERAYGRVLSLPVFPEMTDTDVVDVIRALFKVWEALESPRVGS